MAIVLIFTRPNGCVKHSLLAPASDTQLMPGFMTTTKPHVGFSIIERAERLADLDMDTLRRVYVGFGCDEKPSQRHAKLQTNGMTRGQLVAGILSWEFDKELEQ